MDDIIAGTNNNLKPLENIIELLDSSRLHNLNAIEKVCNLLARLCECNSAMAKKIVKKKGDVKLL